jgi:hypothetical protein
MKRCDALQKLSREHHRALVIALRISKTGDDTARAAILNEVMRFIQADLLPHFEQEETELLPQLKKVDADELLLRTLNEHAQLRELSALLNAGDLSALLPFGVLLRAHVQFEERELFRAAEQVLRQQ